MKLGSSTFIKALALFAAADITSKALNGKCKAQPKPPVG